MNGSGLSFLTCFRQFERRKCSTMPRQEQSNPGGIADDAWLHGRAAGAERAASARRQHLTEQSGASKIFGRLPLRQERIWIELQGQKIY